MAGCTNLGMQQKPKKTATKATHSPWNMTIMEMGSQTSCSAGDRCCKASIVHTGVWALGNRGLIAILSIGFP